MIFYYHTGIFISFFKLRGTYLQTIKLNHIYGCAYTSAYAFAFRLCSMQYHSVCIFKTTFQNTVEDLYFIYFILKIMIMSLISIKLEFVKHHIPNLGGFTPPYLTSTTIQYI